MSSFERILDKQPEWPQWLTTKKIARYWIAVTASEPDTDEVRQLGRKLDDFIWSGQLAGKIERSGGYGMGFIKAFVHRDDFKTFLKREGMWPLPQGCPLRAWWPEEQAGTPGRGAASVNAPYRAVREWAREQAQTMYAQGDTRPPGAVANDLREWLRPKLETFGLSRLPTLRTLTGYIKDLAPQDVQAKRGRPRDDE